MSSVRIEVEFPEGAVTVTRHVMDVRSGDGRNVNAGTLLAALEGAVAEVKAALVEGDR